MMDKAINLLKFFRNENVVRIRDANEYAAFVFLIAKLGLGSLLEPKKAHNKEAIKLYYEDLIKLYKLPQNGKESIGIYPYTVRATVEWYGKEPMSIDDIDVEA